MSIRFLTAEIEIVVNKDQVINDLAKIRAEVARVDTNLSKSMNKPTKDLQATVAKTISTFKLMNGSILQVEHTLGKMATKVLDFHRKMRRNLTILQKIGQVVLFPFRAFVKGSTMASNAVDRVMREAEISWDKTESIIIRGAKAIGRHLKFAFFDMKPWTTKQLQLTRAMEKADELHQARLIKLAYDGTEVAKKVAWAQKVVDQEEQRIAEQTLANTMEAAKLGYEEIDNKNAVLDVVKELKENKNLILLSSKEILDIEEDLLNIEKEKTQQTMAQVQEMIRLAQAHEAESPVKDKDNGIELMDISGVMVNAYKEIFSTIYAAAKWAFGGIYDIVSTVWERIFHITKWRAAGVVAVFTGLYYKLTQAAMDAEDALAFNELGATRTALQEMRDAITGLLAILGKPFLSGIRLVTDAITSWIEESKPQIKLWAEKFSERLETVRNSFMDWIMFLRTDVQGGLEVALDVLTEVFKGFGEVILVTMIHYGKKIGAGFATAVKEGVTYALKKVQDIITHAPSTDDILWKYLESSGVVKHPHRPLSPFSEGQQLGSGKRTLSEGEQEIQDEKTLSRKLETIARIRAANIKTILEDMPTWGETEAKAAEKGVDVVIETMDAMAKHRAMLQAEGGTLDEMRHNQAMIRWDREQRAIKKAEELQKRKEEQALNTQRNTDAILIAMAEERSAYEIMQREALAKTEEEASKAATALAKESLDFIRSATWLTYDEKIAAIETEIELKRSVWAEESEAMALLNEEYQRYLELRISGWEALSRSLKTWANDAQDWGKNLGNILTSSFDRAADSFADMLMKQEVDWKAFGAMFIKELLSMIIKLQMAVVLKMALQGWKSVGESYTGTAAFSSSSGITESLDVGYASGGHVLETGIAKVHRGEDIISAGSGMTVNVTNNDAGNVRVDVEENKDQRTINLVISALQTHGPMRRAVGIE